MLPKHGLLSSMVLKRRLKQCLATQMLTSLQMVDLTSVLLLVQKNSQVKSKVNEWSSTISLLSEIALSQPHAAYAALTHGLLNKWSYLSRVIPNAGEVFSPLDNALRLQLIPALTSQPPPNELEFSLFSLLARLGGLGIQIPSRAAESELLSSLLVTSILKEHILRQD